MINIKRYLLKNVYNMRDLGGFPIDLNTYTKFGQSKVKYMEGFFRIFYENYGETDDCLLKIGLSRKDIDKIKLKLIDRV